jgi:acyl-CoA dehydrogenase
VGADGLRLRRPDTGNAEILALYGTAGQKKRYLQPLLDGDIVSCFSMTEPQAGADPKEFTCKAWREGDEWVIEGGKWYSSNARYASFLIVMAVSNPDNAPHERLSMFIVPAESPGIVIKRNVPGMNDADDEGTQAYIHYGRVRVPADAMLGKPGEAFKVAQARLGGGRIHHAMRTVCVCNRALEMMLERAVSRRTQGRLLADHQFVQRSSWLPVELGAIYGVGATVEILAWWLRQPRDFTVERIAEIIDRLVVTPAVGRNRTRVETRPQRRKRPRAS